MPLNTHNAHMLIPKKLWGRLRTKARVTGRSITDLVVEAIVKYLEPKPRRKS